MASSAQPEAGADDEPAVLPGERQPVEPLGPGERVRAPSWQAVSTRPAGRLRGGSVTAALR